MTDKNMEIWDRVCTTDPSFTKRVEYGGYKYTSIDAHYQLFRATEEFGPIGERWRFDAEYSTITVPTGVVLVFADVTLFWRNDISEDWKAGGKVRGCDELVTAKSKVNTDAPKIAMTNALTKALSHLGFSADVFLGQFDDAGYRNLAEEITANETSFSKAKMSLKVAIKEGSEQRIEKVMNHINKRVEENALTPKQRNMLLEILEKSKEKSE